MVPGCPEHGSAGRSNTSGSVTEAQTPDQSVTSAGVGDKRRSERAATVTETEVKESRSGSLSLSLPDVFAHGQPTP
jgi:hypothetical protein